MTDGSAAEAPKTIPATESLLAPEPPPKAEFFKLKERTNATGAEKDMGLLAGAIIAKKGNQILREKQSLDPQSLKKSVDKPEGEILTFAYLLRPDFKGVRMSKGPKIVMAADGSYDVPQPDATGTKSIAQIFKREGNSFVCDLGDGKPVLIPIETVLSAHVATTFSSQERIEGFVKAGLLSQEEALVIGAYVDSITGKGSESSEKIGKEIIEKLAPSTGLVTADALKSFAELNKRKITPTEPPTPDDQNEAFNKQVDEVIKMFDGRNIASPEDFSHVFQLVAPESIESTKVKLSEQKAELLKTLDAAKAKPFEQQSPEQQKEIEARLTQLTQLETFFEEVKKHVAGEDLTTSFFSQIQIGEIDPETTVSLDEALRENSSQKIIDILLNSKKIDEKTKEKVKKFPKGVLVGGGISLALLFFLIWKGMKGEGSGMSQMAG